MRIPESEAIRAASLILGVIGFEDAMLDNTLDPERRKILSALSTYNIFYVDRQSVVLPIEQKMWRIVRWIFNRDALRTIQYPESKEIEEEESVYSDESIWELVDYEVSSP
ncbi:MAG TPA: hypothetical protein ENF25_03200 [Thermoprotei archaeon]|nr:hypothetical protein [Thermoprotei archaeon]